MNKICLIVLLLWSASAYAQPTDYVVYYPFNGNADDESTNALHGTVIGASLIEDRFGNQNSAYSFDGDSYIDCTTSTLFDLEQYDGYTISAWIKPDNLAPTQKQAVLSRYIATQDRRFYNLFLDNNNEETLKFEIYDNGLDVKDAITGTYDNSWQHALVISDGVDIKMYVNNVLTSETPITVDMKSGNSTTNFAIGAVTHSDVIWDRKFVGAIDDVRIYDRAISVEERNSLFNEELVNSRPAVPSIITYSPSSGPIGTLVKISGENFEQQPDNNVVYFGPSKAQVIEASNLELTVEVPKGAVSNPISIHVEGLVSYSSEPFKVTFPVTKFDPNAFLDKTNVETGDYPFDAAYGDLDGDGKVEVVVANLKDNTVSVFRNESIEDEQITLTEVMTISTENEPWQVDLADVSGDGKLDLIILTKSGHNLSILTNSSSGTGNINFSNREDFNLPNSNPYSFSVADLNNDGQLDIAVGMGSSPSVEILENKSTGNEDINFEETYEVTTSSSTRYVALNDLDKDGKVDLVILNWGDQSIAVHKNNTGTNGVLKFELVDYYSTGPRPGKILIGDLDADGFADILVGNTSHPEKGVSIFRNLTADNAALEFSTIEPLDIGEDPLDGISLGDLNGDGRLELIVVTYKNLKIYQTEVKDKSIKFSEKIDYNGGTGQRDVSVVDLDGDNKPDLILVGGGTSMRVIRNATEFVGPPEVTSFIPNSGSIGTEITIRGSNFSTIRENNIVHFGSARATVLSATSNEIKVLVPAGATYEPTSVLVNGLMAYAKEPFNVTFPGDNNLKKDSYSDPLRYFIANNSQQLALGDLNQDGTLDLILDNLPVSISIYENTANPGSNPKFKLSTELDESGGYRFIQLADLDGDGKQDLIVCANNVVVFRNTSSLNSIEFDKVGKFSTGTSPNGIAVHDLNIDGRPELIIAHGGGVTSVSILENMSSLGTIAFKEKIELSTGSNSRSVSVGDFDSDGRPDLAVANYGIPQHEVSVFRNLSNSQELNFTPPYHFDVGARTLETVLVCDLDQDDKLDIVTFNARDNDMSILRNTSQRFSDINFDEPINYDNYGGSGFGVLEDMNGDGLIDIVETAGSGLVLFENASEQGSIKLNDPIDFDISVGYGSSDIVVGDINGDKIPDIIYVNSAVDEVEVLLNEKDKVGSISGLKSSKEQLDYSIIAMPFQSQPVEEVLSEINAEGGDFRLAYYNGEQNENYQYFPEDFSLFEPGKGYWFITDYANFTLDADNEVVAYDDTPFIITINADQWNMIGNPYNFPIDWSEVIAHNASGGVQINNPIKFKNRKYTDDEMYINKYEGILLYSDSDWQIEIPASARLSNSTGRKINVSDRDYSMGFGSDHWKFRMNVVIDRLEYDIASFGMMSNATNASYTNWKLLPRLSEYLDLSFSGGFARSMVPNANQYIWDFSVNSSHIGELATLTWDNSELQNSDQGLLLLDVINHKVTDLSERSYYSFGLEKENHSFKLYYAPKDQLQELVITDSDFVGDLFPNPFDGSFIIPLLIKESRAVMKVKVFSVLGQEVYSSDDIVLSKGYQEFGIDLLSEADQLNIGTYIVQIEISSNTKFVRVNKRIIYKK